MCAFRNWNQSIVNFKTHPLCSIGMVLSLGCYWLSGWGSLQSWQLDESWVLWEVDLGQTLVLCYSNWISIDKSFEYNTFDILVDSRSPYHSCRWSWNSWLELWSFQTVWSEEPEDRDGTENAIYEPDILLHSQEVEILDDDKGNWFSIQVWNQGVTDVKWTNAVIQNQILLQPHSLRIINFTGVI